MQVVYYEDFKERLYAKYSTIDKQAIDKLIKYGSVNLTYLLSTGCTVKATARDFVFVLSPVASKERRAKLMKKSKAKKIRLRNKDKHSNWFYCCVKKKELERLSQGDVIEQCKAFKYEKEAQVYSKSIIRIPNEFNDLYRVNIYNLKLNEKQQYEYIWKRPGD